MNYSVTEEQLDRLMKSYWDDKFDGAEIGVIENYVEDNDWYGIRKGKLLLVGKPIKSVGCWYSNGEYFGGGWSMFGIEAPEFNEAMLRYVQDNFGPLPLGCIF
jgi:hypothetical protein